MRIKVEKEKCTGCHLCEMVCSLFHFKIINPSKSGIRILKDDLGTNLHHPLVCRQCQNMKCLGNEVLDETLEMAKFVWKKQRALECPFDGLNVFEEVAYHCNLCGGDPQCVSLCTTGAIAIET